MVVGIHTFPGARFDTVVGNISAIIRFVLNSAVPIFLAVSGYFLCKKSFHTKTECFSFWRKQIPKVYIPTLVWSLPAFCLLEINNGFHFRDIIWLLICGFSIYYFIALIIQCYLLLPLLVRWKKFSLLLSFVVTLISWGFVSYVLPSLPLIAYAGPFFVWIFYFTLGIVISGTKRDYSIFIPVLLIVLGIVLQYFEAETLFELTKGAYGQKMSAIISNTGMILLMFSVRIELQYNHGRPWLRMFEFIGKHSFGIYLAHIYMLQLVSHFFILNNWIVKWISVLLLTIFAILLAKKILPNNVAIRIFGLR